MSDPHMTACINIYFNPIRSQPSVELKHWVRQQNSYPVFILRAL